MIELIAMNLSNASVVIALVCIFWIFRCKQSILAPASLFAILIFVYSLWNFSTHMHSTDMINIIIHNIYIILTAASNACYACRLALSLNLNRRKKDIGCNTERRKL